MTDAQNLTLTTEDGLQLGATYYEATAPNGISILINSSLQTPRKYYRHFATFLAQRGFAVLTYDYRHLMTPERDPSNMPDSLIDSGRYDQAAATAWLRERHPDNTMKIVAHSLGGQIVGLSPLASQIRALFMVGTSNGYWRTRAGGWRRYWFWLGHQLFTPLSNAVFGYSRGSLWGAFDLPAGYARQMRQFCLSPHWLVDPGGRRLRPYNGDVTGALRHTVLTDDVVTPPGSDLDLDDYFPNAAKSREVRTPESFGASAVGHFGFFRQSMPRAAWEDAADWLLKAG